MPKLPVQIYTRYSVVEHLEMFLKHGSPDEGTETCTVQLWCAISGAKISNLCDETNAWREVIIASHRRGKEADLVQIRLWYKPCEVTYDEEDEILKLHILGKWLT